MAVALPEQGLISQNYSRQNNISWLVAQYGDGFQQRAIDGANASKEKVSLSWENIPNATADSIESVLLMSLTTHLEWSGNDYYLNSYSVNEMSGGLKTITAELEQKL